MKVQTRFMSLVESWTNIVVGLALQVGANFALLPILFGIPFAQSAGKMVIFAGAMTVLSLARGYGLRRVFERIRQKGTPPDFQYVIEEVARERTRQIEGEGFTTEHDDSVEDGSIARAAAAYAFFSSLPWAKRQLAHIAFDGRCAGGPLGEDDAGDLLARLWPRSRSAFKPTTARRDLIKAAAMIVAEIGRIDRARYPHGKDKPYDA